MEKIERFCDQCKLLPFYEELQEIIRELKKENKDLKKKVEELQKDFLTGAYTRSTLDELLRTEYQEKFKKSWFFNMCLIDIDGLHELNRIKGYEEGDKLIKNIMNILKQSMDDCNVSGKIFRIGGDEFLIVYQPYDKLILPDDAPFTYACGAFNSLDDFRKEFKRLDKIITEKKKLNNKNRS